LTDAELDRLRRRLERERRARQDAESVAESVTRELYEKVQELAASKAMVEDIHRVVTVLQRAAEAANQARTFEEAAHRVIEDIVEYTGWPTGRLYVLDDDDGRTLRSGDVALAWGEGLPGRALASRRPVAARDDAGTPAFALPVLVGEHTVAVLEFVNAPDGGAEVEDKLVDVLPHIASQLGRVVERTRAEAAVRASEEQTRLIIETADDAFVAIDAESRIVDWNGAATRTFGWDHAEAVGKSLPETIIPERHREAHLHGLARFRATGTGSVIGRRLELTALRRDGTEFPVELTPWSIGTGEGVRFNAFLRDITQRKEFERQLQHQALHDVLTGLPNRALLLDRIVHAVTRSRREGGLTAVLFLDLDRFKAVNDTLGHDAGDQLLLAVTSRLQAAVRPGDTLARLGGDEFVVVGEGFTRRSDVASLATRLIQSVEKVFVIKGVETSIGTSIGVAISDSPDQDAEELLGDADMAMYRAKERGRGVFEMFDESMRQRLVERLATESALRTSIERNEFDAVYQPIVSLADGRWTGAEALLRWRHPERGVLLPAEFMPVAEETGLIVTMGTRVLADACAQLVAWGGEPAGNRSLSVAVNVSVRQLQMGDLPAAVRRLAREIEFAPERLVLEITEGALMQDEETLLPTLAELRELGVGLALDDFGTGYSSLGRLSRMPVDRLKLDGSLVRDIDRAPSGSTLVAAAISMAHSLGLRVVAEGIETQTQLDTLTSLGCDEGQGFLLAPPMPAEDLHDQLASADSRRQGRAPGAGA
jgi:diguanylate cyclase (GGDEF)-like protein/PAS domain S-box-containing protein